MTIVLPPALGTRNHEGPHAVGKAEIQGNHSVFGIPPFGIPKDLKTEAVETLVEERVAGRSQHDVAALSRHNDPALDSAFRTGFAPGRHRARPTPRRRGQGRPWPRRRER